MTDPNEPTEPTEDLDPAREAAVRRTLAAAGGPEAMPAEVAARLDGVIAGLAEERSASGTPSVSHPEHAGIVVPLDDAARRRRVRVRALLGAAAAVVAVAVGAGVVNGGGGGVGDATSAASDEAPAREAAGGSGGGSASEAPANGMLRSDEADASADEEAAPTEVAPRGALQRVVTDEPLRQVRPDRLREDLVAIQHLALPTRATADYSNAVLTAPADFMCEPADFGAGYLVGVTYDGGSAVVAFREPMGSNQVAEVLACGTGDVLHSTILPAS